MTLFKADAVLAILVHPCHGTACTACTEDCTLSHVYPYVPWEAVDMAQDRPGHA